MFSLQKLAGGMDVIPAHNALLRQPELWENSSITLRDLAPNGEMVNWYSFDLLPQLRPFVFGVMGKVEGEYLGKVAVYRLACGEKKDFTPRVEQTYLVSLHAVPGVSISAGQDAVMLLSGDVWWVDHSPASIINNSADDFIFLVIHAKPSGPATYAPGVSS